MTKDDKFVNKLTVREYLALQILMLMVKILRPYSWSHEWDKQIVNVEKALDSCLNAKD